MLTDEQRLDRYFQEYGTSSGLQTLYVTLVNTYGMADTIEIIKRQLTDRQIINIADKLGIPIQMKDYKLFIGGRLDRGNDEEIPKNTENTREYLEDYYLAKGRGRE